MINQRDPSLKNKVRRKLYPWIKANVLADVAYGAVVGSSLSLITAVIYLKHGF